MMNFLPFTIIHHPVVELPKIEMPVPNTRTQTLPLHATLIGIIQRWTCPPPSILQPILDLLRWPSMLGICVDEDV
jgi:hypothetical protein